MELLLNCICTTNARPPELRASSNLLEDGSHKDTLTQPRSLAEQAEQLPARPSKAQQRMIEMPRVRDVELRPGRQIKWSRVERREGVLGQTRGEIADPECYSCAIRQSGPFKSCVTVPGAFQGQCCNCRYLGTGSCTFRQCKSAGACSHRQLTGCSFSNS